MYQALTYSHIFSVMVCLWIDRSACRGEMAEDISLSCLILTLITTCSYQCQFHPGQKIREYCSDGFEITATHGARCLYMLMDVLP